MQTNILVGGRFLAPMMASALQSIGEDFTIYSSAPKQNFVYEDEKFDTSFLPLPFNIMGRLFGTPRSALTNRLDMQLFDILASQFMKPHDVLWGLAGFSLGSAKKTKKNGGVFILERYCPHVAKQEEILAHEAARLEVQYEEKPQRWMDRSIEEYELADIISVPSDYSYNSFIEQGFPKEKIYKVPLQQSISIPPPKEYTQGEVFTVGIVGGNLLRKGYLYLLEAWKQLNLSHARLLIRSSETVLRRSPVLVKLLAELENVEIVPQVPDIKSFYARCDIFCLPSTDDGFGLVAMEAMACSLPVIITRNVGACDLLKDAPNVGFIIDPFDSVQLAEKILYFYENRSAIEAYGANAYQFVNTYREKNIYNKSIEYLYRNVIPVIRK